MLSPTSSPEVCSSVDALYTSSKHLRIIFAIQAGTTLLAILCLFLIIFLLCAWKIYSTNIRILIVAFCSSLIFTNVSIIISSIYHLQAIIMRSIENRCYWLSFGYFDCYVTKNITNILLFLIYSGTAVISLERIINTLAGPPQKTKNVIAYGLIVLQFLSPFLVIFRSPPSNAEIHSHCIGHFSNLVQWKQIFFILIGIEMFALAVFTILQLQYAFIVCRSRPKRISFQLYSSINDTQITFPIICVSIALFLINVLLDPVFILTAQDYFPHLHLINESRSIKDLAFWNELQALTIPIFSLIVFGFLIRHALSMNATGTYDKALSDCANSLKTYYETMKLPPEVRQCRRTKSFEEIYNCIPKTQNPQKPQQPQQSSPGSSSTSEKSNKKHKVNLNEDAVAL